MKWTFLSEYCHYALDITKTHGHIHWPGLSDLKKVTIVYEASQLYFRVYWQIHSWQVETARTQAGLVEISPAVMHFSGGGQFKCKPGVFFLSCRIFPQGNREKFAGGKSSSAKLDEIIVLEVWFLHFLHDPRLGVRANWAHTLLFSVLITICLLCHYSCPFIRVLLLGVVTCVSAGQYSACLYGLISTLSCVCCNLADRSCSPITHTNWAKYTWISNCSTLKKMLGYFTQCCIEHEHFPDFCDPRVGFVPFWPNGRAVCF